MALIVADFAVLGFFKYSEFLAHNLNQLAPARASAGAPPEAAAWASPSSPSSW